MTVHPHPSLQPMPAESLTLKEVQEADGMLTFQVVSVCGGHFSVTQELHKLTMT